MGKTGRSWLALAAIAAADVLATELANARLYRARRQHAVEIGTKPDALA